MRLKITIIVAAVSIIASPAVAGAWRCQPFRTVACNGDTTCPVAATEGSYNRVDFTQNLYSRCDKKGCETYNATISQDNLSINIEVPGRSTLAKMTPDGKAYLEAFTVLGTVVVSHGTCAPE